MSDREFVVIASRLVWGEREAEVSHQDTLKRLKALLEAREQLAANFKAVGEPDPGHARLPVSGLADVHEASAAAARVSSGDSLFPNNRDGSGETA